MLLKRLLDQVTSCQVFGNADLEIEGIEYDSRRVSAGSCFVCIRGFQADGRAYAASAVASGAVAILYDEADDAIKSLLAGGVTGIQVPDARIALGELSAAFYGAPSEAMLMVGVTGTNGKTSITHLVADLWEQLGHRTAVFGTIANRVGDTVLPATVTTPESLELNRMLSLGKTQGVSLCAMEVSSHAMALNRVAGLRFDYGIFTNLTKDHLDFHETMEAYFQAKSLFFRLPRKALILNVDDPYGRRLAKESADGPVPAVTYGIDTEADLRAENLRMTGEGTRFTLHWKEDTREVNVPIPGKIYVYNILAALAVLLLEGIPLERASALAGSVKPLRGRLEPVPNNRGLAVLIDYAHTPDGLENAIRSARIFTTGRLLTVFGCGGNRDRTKRPQMGAIAGELSDFTYVTSDNPRKEEPLAIIDDILAGMGPFEGRYVAVPDRAEAILRALREARPGDTVLIAGKGHETYQIIGETRIHFDDREEVLRWLTEEQE